MALLRRPRLGELANVGNGQARAVRPFSSHPPGRAAFQQGTSTHKLHGSRLRYAPVSGYKGETAQKENARGERAFSVVDLGVLGSSTYPRGDFGGLVKKPREFKKLLYRTSDAFELVTVTGLPALIMRAVCV